MLLHDFDEPCKEPVAGGILELAKLLALKLGLDRVHEHRWGHVLYEEVFDLVVTQIPDLAHRSRLGLLA